MKPLLKILLVACFLLSGKISAQCPIAGTDSSATYCKNEVFDLSTLLSADADSGGVFINPYGDTLISSLDSLFIPGIYTYHYIVSDSACENDTAAFYVTIVNCPFGGVNDLLNESPLLSYPNPAIKNLILSTTEADDLLIYNELGECVFRKSAPMTAVIDISQLAPGLYLLLLQQDGAVAFQRFLKIDAP